MFSNKQLMYARVYRSRKHNKTVRIPPRSGQMQALVNRILHKRFFNRLESAEE